MTPGAAMAVAGFIRKVANKLGLDIRCWIWDEHVKGPIRADEIAKYDLCLLTYLTPSRLGAYRVADLAKDLGVPTIAGGIDVTGLCRDGDQDQLMEHFDAIYSGHLTVASWQRVLRDWLDGVLDGNVYQPSAGEGFEFVFPAWDLIDIDDYLFAAVQSSAGCPYKCGFCAVGLVTGFGKAHLKPIKILEAEITYLLSAGVRFLVDCSDCFGANLRHYEESVLPLLKETGIPWATEISIPLLVGADGESGLLEAMEDAGCVLVYIGIESLKKDFGGKNKVSLVKRAIERCNQLEVMVLASLVLDCEAKATARSVKDMISQLLKLGVHFFQFSLIAAIPGTRLHARVVAEDGLLTKDPQDYDGLHATILHNASPEERTRWLKYGWRRVYGPRNLIRLILWVRKRRPSLLPILVGTFRRIQAGAKMRNKTHRPSRS